MSKKTAIVGSFLMLLVVAGCAKNNSVNTSENNPFANPDAIKFSPKHYAKSLRTTYLKLAYKLPALTSLEKIENAASTEEAKSLYEDEIDTFVESSLMEKRLQNYFRGQLGVWSDAVGEPEMRYPVNLGVYVFLNGLPMDEFFTADYAVDDTGSEVDASYTDGPPASDMAGFITHEAYINTYINQFKFHLVREVMGIGLNSTGPFTNIEVYRWDASMLANIYRFNPEVSDINCEPCHNVYNWARLAFRNYDTKDSDFPYIINQAQGDDQFNSETSATPNVNNEPRNSSNQPYTSSQINNYVKLTESGSAISTPREFALSIVEHPSFASVWTERVLTILLDLEEGSTGTNKVVPQNFSENDTQKEFLAKWTTVFEENNRVPQELMRTFLKSNQYLVLVYEENGGN